MIMLFANSMSFKSPLVTAKMLFGLILNYYYIIIFWFREEKLWYWPGVECGGCLEQRVSRDIPISIRKYYCSFCGKVWVRNKKMVPMQNRHLISQYISHYGAITMGIQWEYVQSHYIAFEKLTKCSEVPFWTPLHNKYRLSRYGNSHYKQKTVVTSYLYNGYSCTGKTTCLYWNGLLILINEFLSHITS